MRNFFAHLVGDIRYSLRRIRRRPTAALAPIVIMAVGVAASSAIFVLVDLVVFKALPFPDANRLVSIYSVRPGDRSKPGSEETWNRGPVTWAGWEQLRKIPSFDEVGLWARSKPLVGSPAEAVIDVWHVSSSLLTALGVQAQLGRSFSAEDDSDRMSEAVILTHEAWQRRYGGSLDVIGTTVVFTFSPGESEVNTIVGVLAPGFRLRGASPEFLFPIGRRRPSTPTETLAGFAVARLEAGISLESASRLIKNVRLTSTREEEAMSRLVSLREDVVGTAAPPAWILIAATAILLLVTSASVAEQFLGEARRRRGEIALRMALGSGRKAILRQLVVEQSIKALCATVIGCTLAVLVLNIIGATIPADLLGSDSLTLSGTTLLFGMVAALGTALVFGVGPTFLIPEGQPRDVLVEGAHLAPPKQHRLQKNIVAAQLTLTLVLLVCATLLGQSLVGLRSQSLGFDPARLAVLSLKMTEFPDIQAQPGQMPLYASWSHTERILESVLRVPGVTHAAGVSIAPFAGPLSVARVTFWAQAEDRESDVQIKSVTPSYFDTMGIALVAGRLLQPQDRQTGLDHTHIPVVVSREVAKAIGTDVLGHQLVAFGTSYRYEVVGIVENVKHRDFAEPDLGTVYRLNSTYTSTGHLVIRTEGSASSLLPTLAKAVRAYDTTALVTSSAMMDQLVARSVAEETFRSVLSGIFAGAVLLLSTLGIYVLGMRMVEDRQREIGIRCALGAVPRDVFGLIVIDVARTTAYALIFGVPIALLAAYLLRSFLVGVSPFDVRSLLWSALLLSGATVVASLRPARRASRADPAVLLRR